MVDIATLEEKGDADVADRQYRVPSPEEAVDQLVGMLELKELEPAEEGGAHPHTEDRFLGPVFEQAFWRVFGGQVLAQCAVAAMRTVEPDRAIHSVHGYFLRPGDSTEPIEIGVERLRDGGSFSARRSQAYQGGRPILSMIASFQRPSPGPAHQLEMPAGIPEPGQLASPHELIGHVRHPVMQEWGRGRPFEIRHVDRPIYLEADRQPHAVNAVWMRTKASLPDDPAIHRAALLYASDYTLLEPVLRRHGLHWAKPGMKIASLDHAMWWHRDARADDWLLYVQNSPAAQGSRGLAQGHIFTTEGRLVATVAQEGMVRPPEGLGPKVKEQVRQAVLSRRKGRQDMEQRYRAAWSWRA